MSKLRLLTVFSAHAAFPVPAPPSGLTSLQEVAWVHHHFLHWTNVRGLSVERRGATSSAPLLLFPDLSIVFPSNNNRDVESMFALIRAGHDYNAWPRQTRSHETNSFSQGHCSVKPSPFHPNAEGVTLLVHIFAETEGLTSTRPLSSSTSSQDRATFSTSLTSLCRLCSSPLHVHTTVVRTLATPHQQGEFTLGEDAQGLHTETPYTARVRELSGPAAYARSTNPAAKGCGEARRHLREMSRLSSDQLA